MMLLMPLICGSVGFLLQSASTSSIKSQDGMAGSLGSDEVEAGDKQLQSSLAENVALMQQVMKERDALEVLLAQKQQVSFVVRTYILMYIRTSVFSPDNCLKRVHWVCPVGEEEYRLPITSIDVVLPTSMPFKEGTVPGLPPQKGS